MSGLIPSQFVDELLTRIDIVEVIDARVALKKQGREFAACCPFHNEKTPSFTVSPSKQFYHCFGCGAHGTAIGFLMEYEHMSFPEAVEELARSINLTVPREGARPGGAPAHAEGEGAALYDVLERAASAFQRQLREHPQRRRAVDYLKRRGLSGEIAQTFGLGYAPPGWDNLARSTELAGMASRQLLAAGLMIEKDADRAYDRFRDRIMFPIRDRRGRVVGFGGRVLGDEEPKYLNSPETAVFHKGRELYGLYEARKALRHIPRLLVVEGYMDVIALAQNGIRNAVATLGTATTAGHLERLFRVSPEVVFCFDGDRAGREAAWRALEQALPALEDGRQVRFLFLPDGEDPDSYVRRTGQEAFEQAIADAVPFSTFFFQALAQQTDMNSMDGRARLVKLAEPLLKQLPRGALRQLMLKRLGELSGLERAQLQDLMGERSVATRPPRKPRRDAGATALTPLRHAIALLLHRPSLAMRVRDPTRLGELETRGAPLLLRLLEVIQAHPHISTAALLERWRETPEGVHLARLAQWRPLLDDDEAVAAEFDGVLQLLEGQWLDQRTERMLAAARAGLLSPEEKAELPRLLAARAAHRPLPTADS
ncbi:DNA primase [Ectothiorhodospiraceae bacterium 2226]|nr:DNA primase [Ectothiorhodospiraceae bacterium 2226]